MKKLLFQKFLKDTLKSFIIISLSIGLIVWVIQAVGFLDFVTEDGHSLYVYFSYSLLSFPKMIHRILPFIFFISLFYQISQYELKNELIIKIVVCKKFQTILSYLLMKISILVV